MTVTSIRSRSADNRRLAIAPTSLTVFCRTRGRGRHGETTVSVAGEIDARNAPEFARAVRAAAGGCAAVVLDLTEVAFMAVDGMAALHAINAHLIKGGAPWCVVASPSVSRVLHLCDPEGLIPVAAIPSLRSASA